MDEIEIEIIEEEIIVEISEGNVPPDWGMIGGDIENQIDLMAILASKSDVGHYHTWLFPVQLTDEDLNDILPDNTTFYFAGDLNTVTHSAFLSGTAFGLVVFRNAEGYRCQILCSSGGVMASRVWRASVWSQWQTWVLDGYSAADVDQLLNGKSDVGHNHDDRYYTEQETDTLLNQKANTADLGALAGKDKADWSNDLENVPSTFPPSSHNHDDRYYTEQETNIFLSAIDSHLDDIDRQLDEIDDTTKYRQYGVSGIGQSASALTRLYDAVGMTAQVGTDGDNSAVINDFDGAAPWKRRKCVGEWSLVDGRAKFTVNAYYGDADYKEDGSMGDYVAVECPLCYYSFDGSTLVISGHKHSGMRPFDIFCHGHDENDLIEKYYAPAYALGKDANGYGASLPGLDNEQGFYKSLLDTARTYKNGALGNLAILEPESLNFYEWALFTVEFAQQNSQNVIYGCANLRNNGDDRFTFRDATHGLTSNYNAGRIAGQNIAILATSVSDINHMNYKATHKIVTVTRCDASGNPSSSGNYQLLELEDLGKNYWTYDYTGETDYKIAGRPYETGRCANIGMPSGSPVNNTSGYYPMQYRYRENVFGNQFKTLVDRFAIRVGTGDSDYYLDHYYLPDPSQYSPSANDRPNASELAAAPFVKLGIQTLHDNYASGYIKSKKFDETWPEQWIPFLTTGGSATTFWADYAYLVNSTSVRSVRLGGHWSNGASDGFSYFHGYNAVSTGSAFFGGDLCFIQ